MHDLNLIHFPNRWNRIPSVTEPAESNRLFNNGLWTEPYSMKQKLEPNRTEWNRYHAGNWYLRHIF